MVKQSEKAIYLNILQNEVDKLINESSSLQEKSHRYEALKSIIDLISQEEEFNIRFDEFSNMIVSMAHLDFSKRLEVGSSEDLFAYIATSLNLLSEELEYRASPRSYLAETMNLITDPVIITDESGKIKCANDLFLTMSGFKNNDDLLDKDINFIISGLTEGSNDQEVVILATDNSKQPAIVSKKEITGKSGIGNGFLYILKEKKRAL